MNFGKMRIKNLLFAVLCIVLISCNEESTSDIDIYVVDCKVNYEQSQLLVDRFNTIRQANGIPMLYHDTILDNICRFLVTNKSYIQENGTFREDSVRQLLYENGIIDYQFSINVVSDKDTSELFDSYLLTNDFCTSYIGYLKYANKHIIVKTKSYLTFVNWYIEGHCDVIDGFSNETTAKCYTDSVACTLRATKSGKYYCQFCDHIPLIGENLVKLKRFEMQKVVPDVTDLTQDFFDLVIGTIDVDKCFVITDENMKRLAVLK